MGNHYVRSRGFHCEWAKGEHPRSEIADVPTSPCPPLEPGVSGSSPSTLTTSLTTPIPSSSSLNRPTTTMLTTRGLCPGGSGGWASPKFVRLLWWRYWVMVGFLEIQGPNCQWNPPLSTTKSNTCLFKNKKKTRRRRHTCTREVEDPLTGHSHFHYRNNTEPADKPVDPASEQNHMGPPGQFLTSLDSSGSVGLWSGILRV